MMKKLVLMLILVLGMASLANAQLQISVHNNPPGGETWDPMNPADSEITIAPSQYLMIDIWTTTEIYSGAGEGYFLLGIVPTKGTLTGGVSLWPTETGVVYYSGYGTSYLPTGEVGDLATVGTFLPQGGGITGTVFDQIIFHCEGPGDAVLHLYSTDWVTPTLIDSVVIHQVPEPTTIALLGFGGLLLRRRKK
jgi:hypothetical protein